MARSAISCTEAPSDLCGLVTSRDTLRAPLSLVPTCQACSFLSTKRSSRVKRQHPLTIRLERDGFHCRQHDPVIAQAALAPHSRYSDDSWAIRARSEASTLSVRGGIKEPGADFDTGAFLGITTVTPQSQIERWREQTAVTDAERP